MLFRVLPLVCAAVAAVSGAAVDPRWSTSYNDQVDAVLNRVKLYGPQMGLDPMPLPDINRTVSVDFLFEKLSAGATNTQGVLQGGTTLRRTGNATARVEGSAVYVQADVDFVNLDYVYTSRVEFLGLSTSGQVTGSINDLVLNMTLKVDLSGSTHAEEELSDLTVKNTGGLTVHFDNGMTLLDELIDAISDEFTEIFKNNIVSYVQPEIKKAVEYAIKKID
ncbi:uncharacterized protein LOC134540196 [Bacillus rossius redtenbacheri]|uniref:uncharacterized protein LOC134540196 n=1 Tax=Bacillus rossius redtenbacheri TaxID=93214 RepID=UPI002FDE7AA4